MESEPQADKTDGVYLHNISAHFSPAFLKKAGAYPVRELEQESKGRWLAFADDGAESHDVQITIEKKKITAHSCDCKEPDENFCKHKVAVLLKIADQQSGQVSAQKRVVRKRSDPVLNLLEQVDADDLKSWVKEILQQQKDLSIAFLNRFTINPADYTDEEIQLITDKAVKSIVKNKRKIDQSELKKIVALLKQVHAPVMDHYLRNITDSTKVSLLAKLLESIENWHVAFKIKSTKIPAYKTELLAQTIQPLYDIENVMVWQKVIAAYFEEAFKGSDPLGGDWQHLLMEITKLETRKERVDLLLATFREIYLSRKILPSGIVAPSLTKIIWDIFNDADRLPHCLPWITPIYHDNAFNMGLVDALMENGLHDIAEQHCLNIIKRNYYEEYNIPYQERLLVLYKNNPAKRNELHQLLLQMLPASGTFDDHLLLLNEYFRNDREALHPWKMKILSRLAVLMREDAGRAKLLFAIYNHDDKPDSMLDKLSGSCTLEVAVLYFEKLFNHSRQKFLELLAKYVSKYNYFEYNEQFYPALAALVRQHYSSDEIASWLLNHKSYHRGDFANYFELNMVG
ncbi:MAG TPA: hypothetical protein VK907_09770 [Phnomibacter sp.]|nr:hypothetical protein [Phnomibacter sp.]